MKEKEQKIIKYWIHGTRCENDTSSTAKSLAFLCATSLVWLEAHRLRARKCGKVDLACVIAQNVKKNKKVLRNKNNELEKYDK